MNELALDQQALLFDLTPAGWKPCVSAQDSAGVFIKCRLCGLPFLRKNWQTRKVFCDHCTEDARKAGKKAFYEKHKTELLQRKRDEYQSNGDELRQKALEYYYKNRERIRAVEKANYPKNKDRRNAQRKLYYKKNSHELKTKSSNWRKQAYKEVKDEVYKKYGSKCAWCPESDIRLLQIDHLNGKGCDDRRKFKNSPLKYLQNVLLDTTGKYQLLCPTCNWKKRILNNEIGGKKPAPIAESGL